MTMSKDSAYAKDTRQRPLSITTHHQPVPVISAPTIAYSRSKLSARRRFIPH